MTSLIWALRVWRFTLSVIYIRTVHFAKVLAGYINKIDTLYIHHSFPIDLYCFDSVSTWFRRHMHIYSGYALMHAYARSCVDFTSKWCRNGVITLALFVDAYLYCMSCLGSQMGCCISDPFWRWQNFWTRRKSNRLWLPKIFFPTRSLKLDGRSGDGM